MKSLNVYSKLELGSSEQVFDWLLSGLSDVPRDWDYFVNWEKARRESDRFSGEIELLQSVVGVEDFDQVFLDLLIRHPSVVSAIPSLLVRTGERVEFFKMVNPSEPKRLSGQIFDLSCSPMSMKRAREILEFVERAGLRKVLANNKTFSLKDYLFGVEAGLDSNGRKNRSGKAMEAIVKNYLAEVSEVFQLEYVEQKSIADIEKTWGVDLATRDTKRRYDFAAFNGTRVFLIETNGYNSGGSKLKSTAAEYVDRVRRIQGKNVDFIWITDGTGWVGSHQPLWQAFQAIDYLLNLKMIANGCLEEILLKRAD